MELYLVDQQRWGFGGGPPVCAHGGRRWPAAAGPVGADGEAPLQRTRAVGGATPASRPHWWGLVALRPGAARRGGRRRPAPEAAHRGGRRCSAPVVHPPLEEEKGIGERVGNWGRKGGGKKTC
jgi:hypothetical protein